MANPAHTIPSTRALKLRGVPEMKKGKTSLRSYFVPDTLVFCKKKKKEQEEKEKRITRYDSDYVRDYLREYTPDPNPIS